MAAYEILTRLHQLHPSPSTPSTQSTISSNSIHLYSSPIFSADLNQYLPVLFTVNIKGFASTGPKFDQKLGNPGLFLNFYSNERRGYLLADSAKLELFRDGIPTSIAMANQPYTVEVELPSVYSYRVVSCLAFGGTQTIRSVQLSDSEG